MGRASDGGGVAVGVLKAAVAFDALAADGDCNALRVHVIFGFRAAVVQSNRFLSTSAGNKSMASALGTSELYRRHPWPSLSIPLQQLFALDVFSAERTHCKLSTSIKSNR